MSVSGTGRLMLSQSARVFSGACSIAVITPYVYFVYFLLSSPSVSAEGYNYGIQRTIPSVRTRFASPSPLDLASAGLRNIDRISIHHALTGWR